MRLKDLTAELDELEPDEKLHWLVEFANELPPVSGDKLSEPFPEDCRIQECQTPVYLWVSVDHGQVNLQAYVPAKSPTVRGLVALLVCGMQGASVTECLDLPDDMVAYLGLASVLGMTRQQGFRGVVARMKREINAAQDDVKQRET